MILRPDRVCDALDLLCDAHDTPAGPERDLLIDDIGTLAEIFAGVTGAPYLRLRLDVVTTNACRKFHVDSLKLRLICTYRGTGTQYGTSLGDTQPTHIFTVPTGAPTIMRGKLFAEHPATGLMHRSPPIEGTGETRLVLVLDPIEDLEEEPEHEFLQ